MLYYTIVKPHLHLVQFWNSFAQNEGVEVRKHELVLDRLTDRVLDEAFNARHVL